MPICYTVPQRGTILSDDKLETLRRRTQAVRDTHNAQAYMADTKNWAAVHTTRYMPRPTTDGRHSIATTAMATNFEIPRATVHVTLNHVVQSHVYGTWDDAPYVIIAPYNDIVAANQNPTQVSLFDTYFTPDLNTGLILPETTRIVMPGGRIGDGEMFRIDGNRTYYDNNVEKFTAPRTDALLQTLPEYRRNQYKRWINGDFYKTEIDQALNIAGPAARKLYNNATDKRAFLRGMFEEDRYAMLNEAVRNLAVFHTMQDMGYQTVHSADCGPVAQAVANAAERAHIPASPSEKAHSNSIEFEMEDIWTRQQFLLHSSHFQPYGLLDFDADLEQLYDFISRGIKYMPILDHVRHSLINNRPIDFMEWYESAYQGWAIYDTMPRTLNEYNRNLAETVRRAARHTGMEYDAWRTKIAKNPGYADFIARLRRVPTPYRHDINAFAARAAMPQYD